MHYLLMAIVAFVFYIKFKADKKEEPETSAQANVFKDLEPKSSVKPSGMTILEGFQKQGSTSFEALKTDTSKVSQPKINVFEQIEPNSSVKPSGATILEDFQKQGLNSEKKSDKVFEDLKTNPNIKKK